MRLKVTPRRDVGEEPDYRFSFANERTFLAWVRTSLALVAGGLAALQLLPDLSPAWGRYVIGAVLVLLGMTLSVASIGRWARNEEAMRLGSPLPPSWLPLVLAAGVAVVAAAAAVLLIVGS